MKNSQVLNKEKLNFFASETGFNLREFYNEHYQDLYYYGLKISGSKEISKDCVQDLFLQFTTNKDVLKGVKSVKAYSLKCLRRRIFFQMGREMRNKGFTSNAVEKKYSSISVEEELIINESTSILEKKILKARNELTSRQQEVLYLRYNLDYSFSVICDIMGIKYQSARNLLSEAVIELRNKLEPVNLT